MLVRVPFPVITPPGVPPPNIGLRPKTIRFLVPCGEPFVAVPKVKLNVTPPTFDPDTCAFSPGSYELVEDGEEIYNIEGGAELDEAIVLGPA